MIKLNFEPVNETSNRGPKTPKLVVEKIYELSQDEGLNDAEIGEIIGLERGSICRIRARYGIPPKNLENRKDVPTTCLNCGTTFYKRRKERHKKIIICSKCKRFIEKQIIEKQKESGLYVGSI